VVAFCDADGSLDLRELPLVTGPVERGEADLVLGRRRPVGRSAWPLHARAANRYLARELRRRTGAALHDLGPMRAARREDLLALGVRDRRSGYPLETVLLAGRAGWRIAEVPVAYRPRTGRSKVTGTVRGTLQAVADMRRARRVSEWTLLVLAKAPRPGRSKTRLAPAFGLEGAARLAAAALADTLDAVAEAPAARRVLVLDGGPLDVDGPCAVALPGGVEQSAQAGGSHADRIAAAFELSRGPALLVGMDTPQVTPALLTLPAVPKCDAWLGPAHDGGWWALALRHPRRDARRVLAGVPMSTPRTGAAQHRSLLAAGLRVAALPVLRDVDEPDDAVAVAALAPGTRFGTAVSAALAAPA
jgi:glycosyltransferase A (GT-A) superfamily protein (DUF2064 family)